MYTCIHMHITLMCYIVCSCVISYVITYAWYYLLKEPVMIHMTDKAVSD